MVGRIDVLIYIDDPKLLIIIGSTHLPLTNLHKKFMQTIALTSSNDRSTRLHTEKMMNNEFFLNIYCSFRKIIYLCSRKFGAASALSWRVAD